MTDGNRVIDRAHLASAGWSCIEHDEDRAAKLAYHGQVRLAIMIEVGHRNSWLLHNRRVQSHCDQVRRASFELWRSNKRPIRILFLDNQGHMLMKGIK